MPTDALSMLPPIDFQSELNEEQYAAVTAPEGPALVLAGAGSGKTRTLTYRVAWLLHKGVAPWEILLLTFTNKAAKEMLGRVEDLCGVDRKRFWGGTFHSIGQRLIRRNAERVGLTQSFTILDQDDAESLMGETIRAVDKDYLKNKDNPKAKAVLDLLSYARNTQQHVESVVGDRYAWHAQLQEVILRFTDGYKKRKLDQQVVDYDDLLERWLELLQHKDIAEDCAKRFRHVLVDEYQDTNALQSAIIDAIAPHHRVMAVGDDAQCIYTWRGADFENLMTFEQRHPDSRLYKIETNYRSSPEILAFANEVLRQQPAGMGFNKELRAVRPSRQKPFVVPAMDAQHQAHFVLRRISGLLEEGYRPSDMAILYRAHYQSMDVQMELSRADIPYTITSGVRFFEQAHIRDLVAHLRWVHNVQDETALARVLCLLPRVGPRGAANLYKLIHKLAEESGKRPTDELTNEAVLKKIPADAREDYRDLAWTLQNTAEAMRGNEPPQGQGDLFDQPGPMDEQRTPEPPHEVVRTAVEGWYGDYVRQLFPKNWQSRREDLDSLIAFAARYEQMEDLLAELVLLNSETSNKSTDPDEETIKMTTVHQAKGLEYPIVFVVGCSQGLFPLKRAIEEGNVEEERRLFYVAVTRAMDELYLCAPRMVAAGGSTNLVDVSQFIQEVPEQYHEHIRYTSRPSSY